MKEDKPAKPVPQTGNIMQKGHCLDCPCYHNCPRMKGRDHCYSTAGEQSIHLLEQNK
jgi:hypothetical protein